MNLLDLKEKVTASSLQSPNGNNGAILTVRQGVAEANAQMDVHLHNVQNVQMVVIPYVHTDVHCVQLV